MECAEFRSFAGGVRRQISSARHTTIMSEMDELLIDLKDNLMSHLNDARKVALCEDICSIKGLTASYVP